VIVLTRAMGGRDTRENSGARTGKTAHRSLSEPDGKPGKNFISRATRSQIEGRSRCAAQLENALGIALDQSALGIPSLYWRFPISPSSFLRILPAYRSATTSASGEPCLRVMSATRRCVQTGQAQHLRVASPCRRPPTANVPDAPQTSHCWATSIL